MKYSHNVDVFNVILKFKDSLHVIEFYKSCTFLQKFYVKQKQSIFNLMTKIFSTTFVLHNYN